MYFFNVSVEEKGKMIFVVFLREKGCDMKEETSVVAEKEGCGFYEKGDQDYDEKGMVMK